MYLFSSNQNNTSCQDMFKFLHSGLVPLNYKSFSLLQCLMSNAFKDCYCFKITLALSLISVDFLSNFWASSVTGSNSPLSKSYFFTKPYISYSCPLQHYIQNSYKYPQHNSANPTDSLQQWSNKNTVKHGYCNQT